MNDKQEKPINPRSTMMAKNTHRVATDDKDTIAPATREAPSGDMVAGDYDTGVRSERAVINNPLNNPLNNSLMDGALPDAPAVDDVRHAVRTVAVAEEQDKPQATQHKWQAAWPGIWAKMTSQFRAEFGETSYRRFLASLQGVKYQDGVFTFRAENFFQAEWVKKNYRYWLLQRFQIEKWQVSDIDFVIGGTADAPGLGENADGMAATMQSPIMGGLGEQRGESFGAQTGKSKKLLGSELLTQFQFDKLVVGDSNEEAINAAKQMLDNFPKLPFNPLFIYGAVGFGKTHLLNAIGHYLKQRYPRKKILYFTAEDFLQYFVSAVRQKEIFSFESNFADIDCLLIDDLHFILGKEGALKALETIVGQFLDRGKMMVLVADRGPRDLSQLGQRILSRLLSGLATELKPLSPDMQKAILRMKALQKGIDLSEDAMAWLAEKLNEGNTARDMVNNHVSPRALSGIINQLMIKMELSRGYNSTSNGAANNMANSPQDKNQRNVLSLEKCQKLLGDFFRPERKKITIDSIQQMVAEYYDITLEELLGKSRLQDIARPRQIAMYLAKMATTRSLPSIGARFRRDHTTVIHAVKTVEGRMMDNPKFQEEVMSLLSKLKSADKK
ncbi:MAG: chromosomal replication initiator protein DnaA [Hydrotalea sp.]|nr:chromosomal replication initiator protein DnaA [Hydrotalea sp.]